MTRNHTYADTSKLRQLNTWRSPTTKAQRRIRRKLLMETPLKAYSRIILHFYRNCELRRPMKPAPGLDIKQFGPLAQGASRFEKSLAQGASRFEKSLAQGPVDFASHWPTNSRHRQHAHSLRQNRSHGKSCNSVHCLL